MAAMQGVQEIVGFIEDIVRQEDQAHERLMRFLDENTKEGGE